MADFLIDHLDPLGQGVSRRSNAKKQSVITFIPKTLPGEQGKARVIKSSKGVEFAELQSLSLSSSLRMAPECPHYSDCAACDYLHTSYENEIRFKQAALAFLLRQLPVEAGQIEVVAAPRRFAYRNRVQLHYRHKYLGYIDASGDRVLEVPHCRLPTARLKAEMDKLYGDKSWTLEHPGHGHVELYEKEDGSITTQWNQAYASGGFTQVNTPMNDVLRSRLLQALADRQVATLLDLFSGAGNLSDVLLAHPGLQRQLVDNSPAPTGLAGDEYVQLDLYAEDALQRYRRRQRFKQVDCLLLDPPRKGFMPLLEWTQHLQPATVVYVSCNPATLARDLQRVLKEQKKTAYRIQKVLLLDMFPGTRHFETLVQLAS